jgi:hypothetical protein
LCIDESREFLRFRTRLANAGALWQTEGRKPELLILDKKTLQQAETFLLQNERTDSGIQEYVLASIHGRKARFSKLWILTACLSAIPLFLLLSQFPRDWHNSNYCARLGFYFFGICVPAFIITLSRIRGKPEFQECARERHLYLLAIFVGVLYCSAIAVFQKDLVLSLILAIFFAAWLGFFYLFKIASTNLSNRIKVGRLDGMAATCERVAARTGMIAEGTLLFVFTVIVWSAVLMLVYSLI